MNGFKSCGLWPYDPNVFTDVDFEAALVTDECMPDQETSPAHCLLIEDTSTPLSSVEGLHAASQPPFAADVTPAANTLGDTDSRQLYCTSDEVPSSCSSSHYSTLWSRCRCVSGIRRWAMSVPQPGDCDGFKTADSRQR